MQDAEEAAAATSPPSPPRRSDVTQPQTAADAGTVSLYSGYALTPGNSTVKNQRCHETPHRIHRTASRRARRVTGRFAPSSVLPMEKKVEEVIDGESKDGDCEDVTCARSGVPVNRVIVTKQHLTCRQSSI